MVVSIMSWTHPRMPLGLSAGRMLKEALLELQQSDWDQHDRATAVSTSRL